MSLNFPGIGMKPRQISIEFHEPWSSIIARETQLFKWRSLNDCRKALETKRLQWQLKRRNFYSPKTSRSKSRSKDEDQTHEIIFIAFNAAFNATCNTGISIPSFGIVTNIRECSPPKHRFIIHRTSSNKSVRYAFCFMCRINNISNKLWFTLDF